MRKLWLLLFVTLSAQAVQKLPSCQELSRLWVNEYYSKLNPDWALRDLACSTPEKKLKPFQLASLNTARAAYVLDKTRFNRNDMPSAPIVSWGGLGAPPESMLDWVSARSRGLVYDRKAESAFANLVRFGGDNKIHLTPADFGNSLTSGIGLAGQLIHESRHVGEPEYLHVACDTDGATNCDPTISEEFYGGGSHAVAALWLAWIYSRSEWPASERKVAKDVVVWVLKNRINGTSLVKQKFALRYLGEGL